MLSLLTNLLHPWRLKVLILFKYKYERSMVCYVGSVLTFSTQEKGICVHVNHYKIYISSAICQIAICLSINRNDSPISVWTNILKKTNKKKSSKSVFTFHSTVLYTNITTNCAILAHFRCFEICEMRMRAAERCRELWVGRVSYQISTAIFLINLEAVICGRSPRSLSPSHSLSLPLR